MQFQSLDFTFQEELKPLLFPLNIGNVQNSKEQQITFQKLCAIGWASVVIIQDKAIILIS